MLKVLSVGIRRNKDSFKYYITRPMSSQADNFITLCFKMSAQNRTLSHVTSCPLRSKPNNSNESIQTKGPNRDSQNRLRSTIPGGRRMLVLIIIT
jgi:hypothetical protein